MDRTLTTTSPTRADFNGSRDFDGGSKNEKKEEEDDVEQPSSATKKPAGDKESLEIEMDVHCEPVVHLTEKVDTKTNEELEEQTFKMRAKSFTFNRESRK